MAERTADASAKLFRFGERGLAAVCVFRGEAPALRPWFGGRPDTRYALCFRAPAGPDLSIALVLVNHPDPRGLQRFDLLDDTGASRAHFTGPPDSAFDLEAFAKCLDGTDKARLVRRLLESGITHLGLGQDKRSAQAVASLLSDCAEPLPLICEERLNGRIALRSFRLRPGEEASSIHRLGPGTVGTAPFSPVRVGGGENNDHWLTCFDAGAADLTVSSMIVLTSQRILCTPPRPDTARRPTLSFFDLIQSVGGASIGLLRFASDCLASSAASIVGLEARFAAWSDLAAAADHRILDMPDLIAAAVSAAIPTGEGKLFVSGWLHDPHGHVERLEWLGPASVRIEVPFRRFRFVHPGFPGWRKDNAAPAPVKAGFAALLTSPAGRFHNRQHEFRLHLAGGGEVALTSPKAPANAVACRNAVLAAVPAHAESAALFEEVLVPAVAPLHAAALNRPRVADRVEIGDLPPEPRWSVVVPLYRNLEFLSFQAAAFVLDPDFAAAELIYVLDSPDQRDEVEHRLRELHALYGLPSRLIGHAANFGYGPAVNTGVAAASADVVALLNSDVVPDEPGWLSRLSQRLAGDAAIAAVGPKLLFADGSLQHAGLYFDRDLDGRWFNAHCYKGYPGDYPPANLPKQVRALTGACLLVRKTCFSAIGGFDESFVIGDFEDSDLCLRLGDAGYRLYYEPAVALFHYERQSILHNEVYRHDTVCAYNRFLHGRRWGRALTDPSAAEVPGRAD